MPFPDLVETDRLLLRRWDASREAEGYAAICADSEVMRYLGGAAGREDALEHGGRLAADWETFGYGVWAVRLRDAGSAVSDHGSRPDALLGYAGLASTHWIPGWEHAVEVGWRLRRSAWGRGYATEAALAAVAAGRDQLALTEVHSFIDPANAASARVAEKLGMAPIDSTPHPRRRQTLVVYHRKL